MKYEIIRQSAIYVFIIVTVAMTFLGVLAVWDLASDDVLGRAVSTVLVVGFGCVVIAYAAGLIERKESSHHKQAARPAPPADRSTE